MQVYMERLFMNKKEVEDFIYTRRLKIIVKPNSPKTEIKGWDKEKEALRVNVKAEPEKGKANKEVIKFFTKFLKKKVAITHGLVSKQKVLKIS
jgi:uncharacterized protein (TIGR00251 family)